MLMNKFTAEKLQPETYVMIAGYSMLFSYVHGISIVGNSNAPLNNFDHFSAIKSKIANMWNYMESLKDKLLPKSVAGWMQDSRPIP